MFKLELSALPAPVDSHRGYLLLLARLDAELEEERLSHPLAKEVLCARLDVAIAMHRASSGRGRAVVPAVVATEAQLALTVRAGAL